ncbi:alpha/beta hydrolase [Candidatus Saccharibacteria bacterium]|nr:MAG: alpha/beta hydrolase [Candidatus Saccharibacteria bacterium]TXG78250.1 MAG: alpha/beta hydrolase [Patescibacteria group bacterium]
MQLIVDDLLTSYTKMGKGRILLLLHGWGDSSKGLHALQLELSKHYQVIAVDLPGFGSAQAPPEPWGLSEYADFIKAFTMKIGIEPEIILGHSNGGAIAVRALARGLAGKRLVLVASAGIRGEYKGRMKALRLVTKAGKALTSPLPGAVKKRLRRKVYTSIGSDMLVAEHLQETFKRVVNDDIRADAAQLHIPTLLIYGDEDVSTPLEFGKKLHRAITDSKLVVVPGGEHTLPTDQPELVTKYVREFLA